MVVVWKLIHAVFQKVLAPLIIWLISRQYAFTFSVYIVHDWLRPTKWLLSFNSLCLWFLFFLWNLKGVNVLCESCSLGFSCWEETSSASVFIDGRNHCILQDFAWVMQSSVAGSYSTFYAEVTRWYGIWLNLLLSLHHCILLAGRTEVDLRHLLFFHTLSSRKTSEVAFACLRPKHESRVKTVIFVYHLE